MATQAYVPWQERPMHEVPDDEDDNDAATPKNAVHFAGRRQGCKASPTVCKKRSGFAAVGRGSDWDSRDAPARSQASRNSKAAGAKPPRKGPCALGPNVPVAPPPLLRIAPKWCARPPSTLALDIGPTQLPAKTATRAAKSAAKSAASSQHRKQAPKAGNSATLAAMTAAATAALGGLRHKGCSPSAGSPSVSTVTPPRTQKRRDQVAGLTPMKRLRGKQPMPEVEHRCVDVGYVSSQGAAKSMAMMVPAMPSNLRLKRAGTFTA